jgi:hypothetical protein
MENDAVFKYLVAVNMVEYEPSFRGLLANICENAQEPTLAEIVVATIGTLMTMGQVPWPVIMKTVTTLRARKPEWLQSDAVAILDGARVMLPSPDVADAVDTFDIRSLTKLSDDLPSFVTTCYSVGAVWERVTTLMSKL